VGNSIQQEGDRLGIRNGVYRLYDDEGSAKAAKRRRATTTLMPVEDGGSPTDHDSARNGVEGAPYEKKESS
jgi:hypothetical protein